MQEILPDVMLDLETFGTDSNSVVVSISAVRCNIKTGEVGEQFEIGLKIQEQLDKGAIIDGDTVMWWLSQSKEAQEELTRLYQMPVLEALEAFNDWLPLEATLWGNGATFDNVILRNLYKRHRLPFTLPFWADNDVRSLVNLFGINTRDFPFEGTKHNGISDCLHQIKYCASAFKDNNE